MNTILHPCSFSVDHLCCIISILDKFMLNLIALVSSLANELIVVRLFKCRQTTGARGWGKLCFDRLPSMTEILNSTSDCLGVTEAGEIHQGDTSRGHIYNSRHHMRTEGCAGHIGPRITSRTGTKTRASRTEIYKPGLQPSQRAFIGAGTGYNRGEREVGGVEELDSRGCVSMPLCECGWSKTPCL